MRNRYGPIPGLQAIHVASFTDKIPLFAAYSLITAYSCLHDL
jgi:hypothetical protein